MAKVLVRWMSRISQHEMSEGNGMAIPDVSGSLAAPTASTSAPWYTTVAASSDPAGRLAQAETTTDSRVLAEAAKVIVANLPGVT
jgi:hypothetical protein